MSMSEQNQTQTAIQAGMQAAGTDSRIREYNGVPVAITPDSMTMTVMKELLDVQDQRAEAPRRLRGKASFAEEASFCQHVNRFKDLQSVIFVHADKFLAVFDYNMSRQGSADAEVLPRDQLARWGLHRAEYAPPLSTEWKNWIDQAGKPPLEQVPFADFIEANMADIAPPIEGRTVPSAADLYTMATKLKIMSNDTCEGSYDRATGESTVIAKVEHNPTGTTKIPREFDLLLPVFEGGEPQRVTVKFRMSKTGSVIKFGFAIPDADRVRRAALKGIRDRMVTVTSLPVLAGQPEQ